MKSNIFTPYKALIPVIAVVAFFITSCSVTKTGTEAEYAALQERIQTGNIKIAVDAAYPLNTFASQQVLNSVLRGTGDNANRIDLTGDGYYLELGPRRVIANLPFYGERRQGGGYNDISDSGIQFDAIPKEYDLELKKDKYQYDVNFLASKGTENYDVEVILFANGNAVIYITSNTRTRIEYRGKVVDEVE
ncbi:DUF4251 domain-containing protein [Nonlabens marinus]|uniref:DUF4251 domain-containing protein n=1 Tax=Nonlabens marinus S1-08 TaxID=1454201 RepID=W8VSM5_9FLAO|nr:DUF4251 domain-containing protein [Nonlabens marinus]BAO56335.1 hypothetical protein NMS_2326 [Nonlabens marinus S1-08]